MNSVKKRLQGRLEELYFNTLKSLFERIEPDGFFAESLTGTYCGEFPRTVGALVPLCLELGRFEAAERLLALAIEVMRRGGQGYAPHVFLPRSRREDGSEFYPWHCDLLQLDAQAHLLAAWARLALAGRRAGFEEHTWPEMARLMARCSGRNLLASGRVQLYDPERGGFRIYEGEGWSIDHGLARNPAFEHSREGRMWDTCDLLTQCFLGAALETMARVAERRGELSHSALWRARLEALRRGIAEQLTLPTATGLRYLEMRLPDSSGGRIFPEVSWVCLAPVAAQWEPLAPEVLRRTVAELRRRALRRTGDGLVWLAGDVGTDGRRSNLVLGKALGWEIEFARREGERERLVQLLDFIERVHRDASIYMEWAHRSFAGSCRGRRWESRDYLPRFSDAEEAELESCAAGWRLRDCGNGEQGAWWCWAMARLRREAGLPVQPAVPGD